ncbi:MAG TPA: ABC transporter permease [Bryobacteraceae bacterium]|jgi:lipopolysaccharide transport system permease protein|nr:ABC transporter permease [Bryobacteraceae bacterium]
MRELEIVEAVADGPAIHLRFRIDQPGVIGWQLYDPATGAFLQEGEWSEVSGREADLRIPLPAEEGAYSVQIAPVKDRDRFIEIPAQVGIAGKLEIGTPRVLTASSVRRARLLRAVPKAFVLPTRTVWRHRKLIGSMVRRDILSRYRGSFGGTLWTFLNPLLLMATYFFVFGVVLRTRFGNDTSRTGFVLYFLAGMLPWLAFSEAVGRSPYVILEYRSFVKKIVFPLETLPVNLVISGAVTEAFGLVIFVIGLLAVRGAIPFSVVWLPMLLIPQILFTAGFAWILAATGVYVRDLGQVTGYLLTLWFFLTPICYPETSLDQLPAGAITLLRFNPLFVLVRAYRAVFLENQAPSTRGLIGLWIVSVAVAVIGYAWFHRLRKSFADVI